MCSSLFAQTRCLLRKHGLRPKKRLGQSFLIDPRVRDLIIEEAKLQPQDRVVEIGAGMGALTEALAAKAETCLALEVDPKLFEVLKETMAMKEGVTLLCEDALHFDFASYLRAQEGGRPAKVVANLPYSLATPLILRLLPLNDLFSFLLLMVQKEVAQRLLAHPGGKEYGSLTVICRYYADISLIAKVPREAFYPRPKVSSALIRLDLLSRPRLELLDPALFFWTVRAAFAQRRKTLRNALLNAGVDRRLLEEAFAASRIDPQRRGETLSLEEFGRLSEALYALRGDKSPSAGPLAKPSRPPGGHGDPAPPLSRHGAKAEHGIKVRIKGVRG